MKKILFSVVVSAIVLSACTRVVTTPNHTVVVKQPATVVVR